MLRRTDNILFSPRLSLDHPLHIIYIDDLGILSPSHAHAVSLIDAAVCEYERRGFIVKLAKVVRPTAEPTELIGVELCGRTSSLSVASVKIAQLQRTTASLLQRGFCTGRQLSQLLGSWT